MENVKKFTRPRTTYRLDFADTDLDGLEVRMRGGKLRTVFDQLPLVGVTDANATPEDAKLMLAQYEELAAHLVDWNMVDDDGNDIPATLEGLKDLELRHVQMIATAWQRAQVDVPGPLPSSSSTGPLPDLPMIPMTAIPESLAS